MPQGFFLVFSLFAFVFVSVDSPPEEFPPPLSSSSPELACDFIMDSETVARETEPPLVELVQLRAGEAEQELRGKSIGSALLLLLEESFPPCQL